MHTLTSFSIVPCKYAPLSALTIVFVFVTCSTILPDLAAREPSLTADPIRLPSPSPSPDPILTIDPATLRPQTATVQVAASNGSTSSVKVSDHSYTANADAAVSLQISSPDLFAPTALTAQPQVATVTLTYSLTCAGATVQVAPLDGGSINGTLGSKSLTVAANGTLVFSFQAPASPGRYHVVTQLGNMQMALPFEVAAVTPTSPVGN